MNSHNKENPKYSILLPTWNKIEYLKHSVNSVISNTYENFELLISDDHSNDGTEDYLKKINDSRVKIFKPPFKLTQTKNYEFLLGKAKGEWLAILGDDDGLMPNFFLKIDEMTSKFKDLEIIKSKRAIYYWKGVEDLYGDRVVYFEDLNKKPKLRNSKIDLFLSLCGLRNSQDIPTIYTSGVVKRNLIEKIKKKSNNFFFHSIVPDYYSMVALSFEKKEYLFLENPITWVGVSPLSTGRSRRIYIEKNKNKINEIFINENMGLSGKISKIMHKIGIYPAYLFEGILKHPYISSFWKGNFLRTVVYCSCTILFLEKKKNLPFRLKINLSRKLFFYNLIKEKKKYNLSYTLYFLILTLLFLIKKIFQISMRIIFLIVKYFKKIIKHETLIIVSNDRDKYPSFTILNDFLKKHTIFK